jgi:putative effector of murein hydrolase LrgA (UPF0299 family)
MDLNYNEKEKLNIGFIINYIKEHFIQILLLLFVPVIIYIIDHITNINQMLMSGIPLAISPKKLRFKK